MHNFTITPADVLIIVGYFISVIVLGYIVSRKKIYNEDDLFLAGREMTWPFIGASMFSTAISSQQFVGLAGLAFVYGISGGAFMMIGSISIIALAVFCMSIYRGLNLYTAPEFFEKRYGRGCRMFVSSLNLFLLTFNALSGAIYAGAVVMMTLFGWQSITMLWFSVIILGVTVGLYTIMGGLRAVIYTDFMQNILLIAAGFVILIVGIIKIGGSGPLFDMTDNHGENMWFLTKTASHKFGWLPLLTGTLILSLYGACANQKFVQRVLSAKNIYHAKMGAMLCAFLQVLCLFFVVAPGIVAAKLFPTLENPDSAFVVLLTEIMPIGIVGLCIAGLLAAIMSTADSGLCAASSLIVYDFAKKWYPGMSEKKSLLLGRTSMFILLVLAMLWAPFISHFETLYMYIIEMFCFVAPPIFTILVFGLFSKKATSKAAITTLAVGIMLGTAGFVFLNVPAFREMKESLHWYFQNSLNLGFLFTLICILVMFGVSRFTQMDTAAKDKVMKIVQSRNTERMDSRENIKYKIALAAVLLFWVAIIMLFSPIGIG